MTNLELLDARIYSATVNSRSEADRQYNSSTDHERCILMFDLVSSTNHRFYRGAQSAFQRTTVFYEICHSILDRSKTIQIAKKMGDGLLAFGTDANEIIDACLLVTRADNLIRNEFRDDYFPFQIRIGVGYGHVRRLPGQNEDYLGSAIDELSKIMGTIKNLPSNHIFVARDFRRKYESNFSLYQCLELGELQWWRDIPEKGTTRLTHEPVEFYLTKIDVPEISILSESYIDWAASNQ